MAVERVEEQPAASEGSQLKASPPAVWPACRPSCAGAAARWGGGRLLVVFGPVPCGSAQRPRAGAPQRPARELSERRPSGSAADCAPAKYIFSPASLGRGRAHRSPCEPLPSCPWHRRKEPTAPVPPRDEAPGAEHGRAAGHRRAGRPQRGGVAPRARGDESRRSMNPGRSQRCPAAHHPKRHSWQRLEFVRAVATRAAAAVESSPWTSFAGRVYTNSKELSLLKARMDLREMRLGGGRWRKQTRAEI